MVEMENIREFDLFKRNVPKTHYAVEKKCDNCGDTNYIQIIKGQTVAQALENDPLCAYCGCKMDAEYFNSI